jgi:protein-tyrosine-phosphatase
MHTALARQLETMQPEVDEIPAERREALDRIAAFVRTHRAAGDPVKLTFICTGNSRRSHMGQLWAAAVAHYLGIADMQTYSGGTEPSAVNSRTLAAMQRAGFVVEGQREPGDNPHYAVSFAPDAPAVDAFSKRFDDAPNPRADFVEVMTCSEADQDCPFVPGAALRISLPYDDPKVADDTPQESAHYDARSRQIATEMLYLFSRAREPWSTRPVASRSSTAT